jgi:hypothetical protein
MRKEGPGVGTDASLGRFVDVELGNPLESVSRAAGVPPPTADRVNGRGEML